MPLVLFNSEIGPYQLLQTPGLSGPGSNGNDGVLRIPQSPITIRLFSVISRHLLVGYPSAEVQSVYSTATADWAINIFQWKLSQFYRKIYIYDWRFIEPIDRVLSGATTLGLSGPGSNLQWRSALHFPKLQHHWNLTIRLFSVISRTLVEVGYHSAEV